MQKENLKASLQNMQSVINDITEKINNPNEDIEKDILRSSISLRILLARFEGLVKGRKL